MTTPMTIAKPDGPPSPPLAVAAVLIFAADPDGLAAFYRQRLGVPLRLVQVAGAARHWACELGHVYVSVWPAERPVAAGAGRVGLALYVRDVQREFERLVAAGVAVDFAPRVSALGIIARLRDPEGNPFELYAPPR